VAVAKLGLTVFLLKKDQVDDFTKTLVTPQEWQVPLSPPLTGLFLPFSSPLGEPEWVSTLRPFLTGPIGIDMRSKAPSALLLLEHQARTFVVTFGHAWLKLKDEWVERDFGLRVALNAIPKDEVVELRSEQVFAKWHLASERAPRAASVDEFGVDFDRDLVAVVEGVPRPSTGLGATVRGSTSLRVKLPMSSLLTTLDTALNFYGSDAFRKDWPDIDRVNVVTDKTVIPVLEQQLDGDLKDDKRRRRIVMFTPSEKRGDSIVADSYVYGSLTKNAPSRPYMTIENWANEIAGKHLVPSVAQAKQSKVHMFEDLNGQQWTHSAFECFGYETSIGGQVYVLSSGVW